MDERKANIDAEIKARVTSAGGQYDGVDVRASLLWNNRNDLDLHVQHAAGEHIFYGAQAVELRRLARRRHERRRRANDEAGRERAVVQAAPPAPAATGSGSATSAFHEATQRRPRSRSSSRSAARSRHVEGVISPNGQTGEASDMIVAEFDYDPNAHASKQADRDKYANYSDDVILAQWATRDPEGAHPPRR